jgi:uncharacterized protein (TIGR03000 family)
VAKFCKWNMAIFATRCVAERATLDASGVTVVSGRSCGGGYPGSVIDVPLAQPITPAVTPELIAPPKKPEDKKGALAPAPAQIVVELPADAALFVDAHKAQLTGVRRTFVTPILERDGEYTYSLRAEQQRFFAEGGVFDQIHQAKAR